MHQDSSQLTRDGRPIRVRQAAYGDAPALHRGLLAVAHEGNIGVEPPQVGDLTATIERLRTYLTNSRRTMLVAELNGQVVGAISLNPGPLGDKDKHWCSLLLWVATAERGAGVGNALVGAGLTWARREGFERAVAEVFGNNQAAITLLTKFGFVTEGRQKNLFVLPGIGHIDNILMALDLEVGTATSTA